MSDFYYPGIADDESDDDGDISSYCSADIEGGVDKGIQRPPNVEQTAIQLQQLNDNNDISDNRRGGIHSVGNAYLDDDEHDDKDISMFDNKQNNNAQTLHATQNIQESNTHSGHDRSHSCSDITKDDITQTAKSKNPMASIIQNERNRRLGSMDRDSNAVPIHNEINSTQSIPRAHSHNEATAAQGGVLGNIRGWFGGATELSPGRRSSAPVIKTQCSSNPMHNSMNNLQRGMSIQEQRRESSQIDNDDYSSSSSDDGDNSSSDSDYSSDSSNASSKSPQYGGDNDLTPQERARARALRYLSNSCVDAGRKSKTASYVRGLERLDLKRKRDRYEKELEIVESEMNKDRGLINNSSKGDIDAISKMAAKIIRELPCIQGADAGAGSDVVGKNFMSYDEYADAVEENSSDDLSTIWNKKESVDLYVSSLQSRLHRALEHTRSLEKRLVVLEQAGDDIISSLCEDLVDVTSQANKNEARYVKKGKELQRKRRREEIRNRSKIKRAERRVRKLEERLMVVSGVRDLEKQLEIDPRSFFEGDDSSMDSSSSGEKDDEDDEVLLEQKLTNIKAKNEIDKDQHLSEVESIRRQCEQLKLRLSVARLVMEGDDNLREYVALLERLNIRQQRKDSTHDSDYGDEDMSRLHTAIPPPPSIITRTRAKLLKVTHLGHIYEQRLAISKAFTDATISALDQELVERETASQKMEVRCLNELVIIDAGIKDIIKETTDKLIELDGEAQELEDAVAACAAEKYITDLDAMFGSLNTTTVPTTTDDDGVYNKPAASDTSIESNIEEEKTKSDETIEEQIPNKPWRTYSESPPKDTPNSSELPENESSGESSTEEIEDDRRISLDSNDKVGIKSSLPLTSSVEASLPGKNKLLSSSQIDDIHETQTGTMDCNQNEIPGADDPSQAGIDLNLQPKQPSSSSLLNEKVEPVVELKSKDDNKSDPHKKKVELERLGHEFKFTLAEYQTSFDLSSSDTRVEQLEQMNKLVLEIARVGGLEVNTDSAIPRRPELTKMNSWSLKTPSHQKSSDEKERRREKRRSKKKKKKKKRQRHDRESREKNDKTTLKAALNDFYRDSDERSQSLVW